MSYTPAWLKYQLDMEAEKESIEKLVSVQKQLEELNIASMESIDYATAMKLELLIPGSVTELETLGFESVDDNNREEFNRVLKERVVSMESVLSYVLAGLFLGPLGIILHICYDITKQIAKIIENKAVLEEIEKENNRSKELANGTVKRNGVKLAEFIHKKTGKDVRLQPEITNAEAAKVLTDTSREIFLKKLGDNDFKFVATLSNTGKLPEGLAALTLGMANGQLKQFTEMLKYMSGIIKSGPIMSKTIDVNKLKINWGFSTDPNVVPHVITYDINDVNSVKKVEAQAKELFKAVTQKADSKSFNSASVWDWPEPGNTQKTSENFIKFVKNLQSSLGLIESYDKDSKAYLAKLQATDKTKLTELMKMPEYEHQKKMIEIAGHQIAIATQLFNALRTTMYGYAKYWELHLDALHYVNEAIDKS